MKLVAQGNASDVGRLQSLANVTEGSGGIEFDIDTQFDIPGPWWLTGPDIKIGGAIAAGIGGLEAILKAIPGVHLDHGIKWTQLDGHGILRIDVRNNPVPIILGAVVAAVLPWLAVLVVVGVVLIIGWKLFKGAIAGDANSIIIIVVIAAVVLVFLSVKKGGGKVPGFG